MKTREYHLESIDDETSEYVKSVTTETDTIRFYLGPFGKWFTPCEEDQERLMKLLEKADPLNVLKEANRSIKLEREWLTDDQAWKEIERRQPTIDDFKRIYDSDWVKVYSAWQEDDPN